MSDLERYCELWGVSDPEFLTETPRGILHKVTFEQQQAVLKIYKGQCGLEKQGAEFLKLCPSDIAVGVFKNDEHAVLLEYLGGSDLVPLVKDGRDDDATRIIADVANKLHTIPVPESNHDFPDLRNWFQALLRTRDSDPHPCFAASRQIANDLLDENVAPVMLHGDIHHENILFNKQNQPKIIDPKGLIGDPAYDVANTMCNPHINGIVTRDRILKQSAILSEIMNIDQKRILAFGFVHACIGCLWSIDRDEDPRDALDTANIFYEIVK